MARCCPDADDCAMEAGGTLLCAIDCDRRAPDLVASGRRWAQATGLRPLFTHACRAPAPEPADAMIDGESERPRQPDRGVGQAAAGETIARAALTGLGIAADELRIVTGDPATALLAAIRDEDPSLILVASSSSGTQGDGRVGSVCSALMQRACRPVAVLPPETVSSFSGGPIACAVSLGDDDEAAVRFAGALASATDRRLLLAHVVGPKDAALLAASRAGNTVRDELAVDGAHETVVRRLDDMRRRLLPGVTGEVAVRAGALADRVVEMARDAGADALVIAAGGAGRIPNAVQGSVARKLWAAAPCAVVVVER